jgi:prepilin-type N-terminal cleavage/methylation domain-containing protein
MNHPLGKKGFSLIEVLVAVGLFSLLSLTASVVLTGVQRSQQHSSATSVVENEANSALYQMTQSIRSASSITGPAASATSSTLTLGLASVPVENPTTYAFTGTTLTSTKGSGQTVPLTSSSVQVKNLVFTNLTAPGTKGTIRIALTLSYTNPGGLSQKKVTRTYYTSVSLR